MQVESVSTLCGAVINFFGKTVAQVDGQSDLLNESQR